MGFQLERQVYYLYEAVEMLYKRVNGILFTDIADAMSRLYGDCFPFGFRQRLEALDAVSAELCRKLPVQSEAVQHFFRKFDTEAVRDNMCLAKALTLSFFQYTDPEPEREAENLKRNWARLQETGFQISEVSPSGLTFTACPGEVPRQTLMDQFYSLNYPAEYKLELLKAFSHYSDTMDALLALVLPYAQGLQQALERRPWLLHDTVEYWQRELKKTSPSQLVQRILQDTEEPKDLPEKRVLFSLMNCTAIVYDLEQECSVQSHGYSTYVIGCAVTVNSTIRKVGGSTARSCAILRSISDRTKFEVLQRLSRERSYGQKLAEEMNINPGQMSRILMALFNYGFLTREQEQSRFYYTTNRESLQAFFRQVEELLITK